MPQAIWNGAVVADSDQTILVEGNHYFPPDSLAAGYFVPSDAKTTCPWKGMASYYDLMVDGSVNSGAAWFYSNPAPAAAQIKGYVAFWRGVEVRG